MKMHSGSVALDPNIAPRGLAQRPAAFSDSTIFTFFTSHPAPCRVGKMPRKTEKSGLVWTVLGVSKGPKRVGVLEGQGVLDPLTVGASDVATEGDLHRVGTMKVLAPPIRSS